MSNVHDLGRTTLIEVCLPETVLSFDGRVVEIFQAGSSKGSKRFHITHLKTAEVTTRRGKGQLKLMFPSAGFMDAVPPEKVTEAEQFIAALLKA